MVHPMAVAVVVSTPQKTIKQTWKNLFDLISTNDENQKEIKQILDSFPDKQALKKIINTSSPHEMGDETMLMWAVWNLKKTTVDDLLKYGANPRFENDNGESVSTYWSFNDRQNDSVPDKNSEHRQQLACEIAETLHRAGVSLNAESLIGSWGLMKRAKRYNLKILEAKLVTLGYT